MSSPQPKAVASPCTSVCRMHAGTGWCEGCLRTIDEIIAWGSLDDVGKRGVLRLLGPRRLAWRTLRAAAGGSAPSDNAGPPA